MAALDDLPLPRLVFALLESLVAPPAVAAAAAAGGDSLDVAPLPALYLKSFTELARRFARRLGAAANAVASLIAVQRDC